MIGGGEEHEGLSIRNCTAARLKVCVCEDVQAFASHQVGRMLARVDDAQCVLAPAMALHPTDGTSVARSVRLSGRLVEGASAAMLLVLNESNVVVGKKAVPTRGTRELHMDLEQREWALCAESIKRELAAGYQAAVERMGGALASPEAALSDEDLSFFLDKQRTCADLTMVLPNFDLSANDCVGLQSYQARTNCNPSHLHPPPTPPDPRPCIDSEPQNLNPVHAAPQAYTERQTAALVAALRKCDLISATEGGDEEAEVALMCRLLRNLHSIDMHCGEPQGAAYKQALQHAAAILRNAETSTLDAIAEERFPAVVHALTALRYAGSSSRPKPRTLYAGTRKRLSDVKQASPSWRGTLLPNTPARRKRRRRRGRWVRMA